MLHSKLLWVSPRYFLLQLEFLSQLYKYVIVNFEMHEIFHLSFGSLLII